MHERLHMTYTFAGFTLDADRSCLTRDGQDIKLRPKSFDSLKYLIENRGRVVSKDELVHAVWPDSFVTDDSLVQCVRDIRRALDHNAQHCIKTVPRRGYIFEAEVVENGWGTKENKEIERTSGSETVIGEDRQGVAPSGIPAAHPAPQTRRLRPSGIQKLWPWIVAALLVTIAGVTAWHFRPKITPPVWRAVPLTSYPGFEYNPALSRSGNQVAFAWNGEKQDNFDIYIKLIGPGEPLRLTRNPAEDVSPAWSPDGRMIAFLRRSSDDRSELLLIPALGGRERPLIEVRNRQKQSDLTSQWPSLAWSPDGRGLVVSHCEPEDPAEGLFLVSVLTGEKRRLTKPPRGFYGDFTPAFSSDGTLAFSRLNGFAASEVYVLSLSGDFQATGEPRRLTHHDLWAASPVWMRDGRHILYVFAATPSGSSELRMSDVSGSREPEPLPMLEECVRELTLGEHLVYSRRSVDTNIWRAEVPSPGGPPSRPQLLISSTEQDFTPQYSPDGKKIAFGSTRSGTRELWVADADGSNRDKLTSFGGPMVGYMNWSPDSQRLVFHARLNGQADLFTIAAAGGTPKPLTTDPFDDFLPSYSHDGHWIYFGSVRSGQCEIWKMPADGGEATQITREGGRMPIESPDGKMLYYIHILAKKGIWKVPAQGGKAMQVTGPLSEPFGFTVTAEGIYYTAALASSDQHLIQFLDFSTGQTRPVVETNRQIGMGLSLSPDGRFLIFPQRDQVGSDLMLIENFAPP
jgi:Tol biopolymer transport system component/DNA-binding winged helix-turn-helix (wHTH) protein